MRRILLVIHRNILGVCRPCVEPHLRPGPPASPPQETRDLYLRTCGFIRLSLSALSASLPSDPAPTAAPSVLACTLALPSTASTSLFLSGLTLTTTWCTVCGTVSRPFRSTHVGRSQRVSASLAISGEWSVAEKKHTWRLWYAVRMRLGGWVGFAAAARL